MGKLGRFGLEPAQRYERARPGELIHIDVKKLGRIERGAGHRVTGKRRRNPRKRDLDGIDRSHVGWEYVHVAIDDSTRLAYAEVLADEKAVTVVGSSNARSRSSPSTASPSSSCLPITAPDTAPQSTQSPAAHCASATYDTRLPPKPTAKPNASSAPSSADGPTALSTAPSAPLPLTAGSGTTTTSEDTQPSATSPRSSASTSEPTFPGLTTRPAPQDLKSLDGGYGATGCLMVRRMRRVRLVDNRDFMLLWTGQAVSQLGSQASTVAFPLLVLSLTGSAAKAGIVGLAKWLPLALTAMRRNGGRPLRS